MATHFPFLPSFIHSFSFSFDSFLILHIPLYLFLFLSFFFSSPSHVKLVTSNIYLSARRGQPLILLNTLWIVCHLTKFFFFKCFTRVILACCKKKKERKRKKKERKCRWTKIKNNNNKNLKFPSIITSLTWWCMFSQILL